MISKNNLPNEAARVSNPITDATDPITQPGGFSFQRSWNTMFESAKTMIVPSLLAAGFVFGVALNTPARAQSAADCIAPQAQQLMNACAHKDYKKADAALNAAWKSAKEFADAIGQGKALLAAQRKWLAYRDAACDVHASPFEGGTIQPLIQSTCLSELTAERTRMLLEFHAY